MDLSICIPYYAEIDYLRHCLAALPWSSRNRRGEPRAAPDADPDLDVEVVVVDDASPEPCAEVVAREFPAVRVIENSENLGFARSVNVAARATTGRYLLVLNADAKVLGGLERMLAHVDEHPDVAAVGPRILNSDGSFQPQCRRGRLTPLSALGYATGLDRVFPRGRLGGYLERWRDEHEPQDVAALSGACMLLRREPFEAAGGFCEEFVLYGEDLDICYRLGEAGWRVVYWPDARVVHAGGQGGTARRYFRSRLHYWRALWLLMSRRAPSGFVWYGWLLGVVFGVGFLGSCLVGAVRPRQVGTRKSGARLDPDQWPDAIARLQPRAREGDS